MSGVQTIQMVEMERVKACRTCCCSSGGWICVSLLRSVPSSEAAEEVSTELPKLGRPARRLRSSEA